MDCFSDLGELFVYKLDTWSYVDVFRRDVCNRSEPSFESGLLQMVLDILYSANTVQSVSCDLSVLSGTDLGGNGRFIIVRF